MSEQCDYCTNLMVATCCDVKLCSKHQTMHFNGKLGAVPHDAMKVNETFSRKTMGAYVQVYQRPSERGPNLDLNFFEGVRSLGEAKTLYEILGEAIACAEGKRSKAS
jgi:hypothetical protein